MSRQLALVIALASVGLLAVLVIESPDQPNPGEGEGSRLSLAVGDAAPPFPNVVWVGTDAPPTVYEPGKVTVLDVWATWCGPCIKTMPHLADLKREYAAEGLVVIAVTSEADNSLDHVREFALKRASWGLPFAFCPGPEIGRDFMAAAGQNGIPTSFVIDREGKIAFIGHPMELDDELPAILAR